MNETTKKTSANQIKFLVCVDEREHSQMALRFACARIRNRNGLIDLLHVLEPVDFQGLVAVADKMREERRSDAEKMLQKIAEEVQEQTGVTPSIIVREGAVEEQIISAAEDDIDANMIVLGASPNPGGRRELISSLARQLGTSLQIPMVIVPGNLTDQQIEQLG